MIVKAKHPDSCYNKTWNLSDQIKSREFGDYMKEYYINTGEVKEFIKRFKDEIKANADVDDAINLLEKLAGEKLI